MNFFFGQICFEDKPSNQQEWQEKTFFTSLKNKTDNYSEDGFALTLINDPKEICSEQSSHIFVNKEFICISDCHLYNKAQLAVTLNLDISQSNEAFIIAAYLHWGDGFVYQFDGPCSFVIWHREEKKLIAGRDTLGYGLFCYSINQNTIYFSSDLATLLDNPKVDKSINLKRLRQSLRYANNTPEQTYFANCYYCPPSHFMQFTQDNTSCNDYWQLDKKTDSLFLKSDESYMRAFNQIVENHLQKAIQPEDNLALLLSGGLDSNLLAAILANKPNHKDKLICYSNVFNDRRNCDESQYINQTTKQLNLNSVQINCDDKLVLSDIEDRFITKDVISQDIFSSLPETLFKRASNENNNVAIMGHYGDDLFGANRYLFADLIHNADIKTIIKMLVGSSDKKQALSEFINYGIRTRFPQTIKLLYRKYFPVNSQGDFFNLEEVQVNNIKNEPRLQQTNLLHRQNLLKLIYYSNTSEGVYYYRKHLYLGHKMRLVMPYYCKEMIEFIWAIPIGLTATLDQSRWLQRQCLRLVGLEHIANRCESTTFYSLVGEGIKKNKANINQILKNLVSIKILELDTKKLNDLINKDAPTPEEDVAITQIVLAELWLNAIDTADESHNQLKQCRVSKMGVNYIDSDAWGN